MTIIFAKTYDSESMVDIFRDINECLDPRFNKPAEVLQSMEHDDISFDVTFKFTNTDGQEQILFKRQFEYDNVHEIEENIYDTIEYVKAPKDENGFFEGDIDIIVQLQ